MSDDTAEMLRAKYRELRRLRDEDAAERASDPKPEMAKLAARFPGALRQIDRLPRSVIEARLAELDACIARGAPAPRWACLEVAYHGRLRATLRVKRAIAGASSAEALARARAAWAREPDEPTEPMNEERLAMIREPPEGRLSPHVLGAVAADGGVTVDELRAVLFPTISAGDADA